MGFSDARRILLTGANGQLGKAIQRVSTSRGVDLIALDRADLDITDKHEVANTVRRHAPTHIVNAAAYTAVDLAESNPSQAYAINCDGAAYLADAACAHGCRMLHVSTDFVFDGEQARPYTPSDVPNPINSYGASKLAGEQAVLEATQGHALIVRTAWVYSLDGRNFLNTMLRLMCEREELQVVEDQVGTPTSTNSLANVLLHAADADLSGIHHWTDAGTASWYDFSVAISEEAFAHNILSKQPAIQPVDTSAFPTAARRPSSSRLDKTSLRSALGYFGRHWRVELRDVLVRAGADR